ncbi:MAG: hypothetical protein ACFE95_12150 [Candidatus Hodarchaeota archaeon]
MSKPKITLTKEEDKEARQRATERLNKVIPRKKVITGFFLLYNLENIERSIKWKQFYKEEVEKKKQEKMKSK